MPAIRHIQRSILILALAAVFALPARAASDDQQSVQALLERGALEEAVERAASDRNPESTYLAAQALIKMDNSGGANEQFGRLREGSDDSWNAIGESGAKLLAGDVGGAMEAADRAVAANQDNPYAHYQLALVAFKQSNFQRSARAFARTIELKPDFAYAHYYGGQAYQRLRQTPKMAEHFQMFVRLAPDAPERQAVQAILRSLR